jgi:TetR/AcrR family acrAB operon transcriptional repressor
MSTESRRRLVEATIDLCGELGPRAFTVNDVAERSGISRGSIPHHFGSKDGLILTMVEEVFANAEQDLRERLGAIEAPSVADVIEAHYVDPHTRHGRVFAGIHQEALFPDTPILGAYVEGWRRLRAVFTDYLRPLVDARPELGDLDQLARAVQSAVVGINLQSHLDHDMDRRAAYTALEKVFESATS